MTDNFELKQLLEEAKQAQQSWDKWEWQGAYDRSPSWKVLAALTQESWRLLHRAMIEAEPLLLTFENVTWEARTVGALTADQMLYFSTNANAKTTTHGTNLRFVCKIEKI